MKLPILLIITAAFSVTPSLRATSTTFTFVTPISSSSSGFPVSASATFTITPTAGSTPGTVQITLKDTQSGPVDIAQLVSDLEFTLSTGLLTGTPGFTSFSNEITVSTAKGVVSSSSDVPISPTGWVLSTFNSGQIVCTVCPHGTGGPGPEQEIIGAGSYGNEDGTITAKPNNPYLDQTATFTITNSSITSATKPTNVVFSFGKSFGAVGSDIGAAPEPGTLVLFGSGLLFLANVARRGLRRSKSQSVI